MRINPAPALVEIAREKSREGKGWDALTAQLAADSYVLAGVLADHPKVLLDVGRAWKILPQTPGLHGALTAYRSAILDSLALWDLAVPVRKKWAALDGLEDTDLEPEGAGAFAAALLGSSDTAGFIAGRRRKAARLQLLAERLFADGDTTGALRCAKASELDVFTIHHAVEAATVADPSLAVVRTALLLAARETAVLEPAADPAAEMDAWRLALARSAVTEDGVPWEEPYFRS